MGRIERGADLWQWLEAFGREHEIQAGWIRAIGAAEEGAYSVYDQHRQSYSNRYEHRPLEIVSCEGNYSLKDGVPFPHIHIAFSGVDGNVVGGHLIPGTRIFLAEYDVQELRGAPLERHVDPEIGLPVWSPGV